MIGAPEASLQRGLARAALLAVASCLTLAVAAASQADAAEGFLASIHDDTTLSTTVPPNGDQKSLRDRRRAGVERRDRERRRAGHQFQ